MAMVKKTINWIGRVTRLAALSSVVWIAGAAHAVGTPPGFSLQVVDESGNPVSNVQTGQTVTLIHTIDNSSNGFVVSNLAFTHNLPTNLRLTTPEVATTTCNTTGSSSINLSGGFTSSYSVSGYEVPAGASCIFEIDVVPFGPNTYNMTSSALSSSVGTGTTSSATLVAQTPAPLFTMSFEDSAGSPKTTFVSGETATIVYTVDATANFSSVNGFEFSHSWSTPLTTASPSNKSTTCQNNDKADTSSGPTSFSARGWTVGAGDTCEFKVDVTSSSAGEFVLATGLLSSNAETASPATGTLTFVAPPPTFSMTFNPGSTDNTDSAEITYTIANVLDGASEATSLAFTHNLSAGLEVHDTPNASTTCTGGTLSVAAGSSSISYSGGTVAAGASCTIKVLVSSDQAGTFDETTGDLTSSAGNSGAASASLTVTDVIAPRIQSITRFSPSAINTDADSLTWRVEFNEPMDVSTISAADFTVSGTTGTLSVNSFSSTVFEVTVSGGDLADLDGTVVLSFNSERQIADVVGNALVNNTPLGLEDITYFVQNDSTPPMVTAFERYTPLDENTNADELVFKITFSEPVRGVGTSSFQVTGTTATGTEMAALGGERDLGDMGMKVQVQQPRKGARGFSGEAFLLTVSGGDLASYNGIVGLDLAVGGDIGAHQQLPPPPVLMFGITDFAGNRLLAGEPATDQTYTVDNSGPILASITRSAPTSELTNADTLVWDFQFSNISPLYNVKTSEFTLTGTTATLSVERYSIGFYVTASGGDLASVNGPVTITMKAGSTDEFGNPLLSGEPSGTNENSYTLDNTAPTITSIDLFEGTQSPTDADTLAWGVRFSEPMDGASVGAADFSVAGTTATLSLEAISADYYRLTLAGGDLAELNGTVTLTVADAVQLLDAAGNALVIKTPTGTNNNQIVLDNDSIGPSIVISSTAAGPVPGSFPVTFTFNEDVTGFAAEDVTVANGTLASFASTSAKVFTADVTPAADGAVTLDIAADVATDAAGNGNKVAAQFSILADATPPGLSITFPDAETTGAFTATFTFTEDVTGFELADIVLGNAAASNFAATSGSVYTALITPSAPGTVSIAVAAAAGVDAAGNDSLEASVSLAAVSEIPEVVIDLSSDIADPEQAATVATISNPGSAPLPFTVQVDVPWITVTPLSGTISPLGTFDLSVSLNDEVNSLGAGDYVGTVTVTVGDAPVAFASLGGADGQPVQSGGGGAVGVGLRPGTILVELPVNVAVQERFGNVQLIATTPPGPSGEASFTYVSDVPAFNNLTLSTSNNRASAGSGDILFGSYDITQTAPPGWRVEAFNCSGDLDGATRYDPVTDTATVDVDPGESIVCVFENVRDEDAVRLATQRAIRNFLFRRADRIIDAAPELSRRFAERNSAQRGGMSANASGAGFYQMDFSVSLAGARNAVAAEEADSGARFGNSQAAFLDGWDIWLAAEASGVRDDRAGERSKTDFAAVQLGVDYLLGDDLIIGAMAQYDWMEDEAREVFTDAGAVRGAQVQGNGWMAGPYAVWRVEDSLTVDGLAMFGESDNRVNPLGLYSDDFDTQRIMVQANVTGEMRSGPWTVRPQAGITQYKETQSAYLDSLGIKIPSQDISLGRFRAGPEVAWRNEFRDGGWLQLSGRLDAIWDYDSADLLTESGFLSSDETDLRADARIGVATQTKWGPLVRLEVGIAGLGAGDFRAETARLEIRVPFGSGGLAQGVQQMAFGPAGMGMGGRCDVPGGGVHSAFASQSGCGGGEMRTSW